MEWFKTNFRAGGLAFIGIAAAVMACVYPSANAGAQSLEEAVELALNTNPRMDEARTSYRAITRELRQAQGRYLPQVDLELNFGPEYNKNSFTRSRPEFVQGLDGAGDWLTRRDMSVFVTQTVFDGFDRRHEIKRQQHRTNSAEQRFFDRGERVGLDATRAYIETLRRQEIVRLAEANVDEHIGILDLVNEQVDAGRAGVGDEQQARARLANAQAIVSRALRDLDSARIDFAEVVGQYPESLSYPEFTEDWLPEDVESAVDASVTNSHSIRAARADADAAEEAIGTAKSRYWPNIDVELRGTDGEDLNGIKGLNQTMSALLKVRYNLYRGGSDTALIREQTERYSQALAELQTLQRELEAETRQSWSIMLRKEREAQERAAQVQANEQVTVTYEDEFTVGRRDLLDLLDSENELFLSRVDLVTVRADALFARYRVLATMGQLRETLNIQTEALAYEPSGGIFFTGGGQ